MSGPIKTVTTGPYYAPINDDGSLGEWSDKPPVGDYWSSQVYVDGVFDLAAKACGIVDGNQRVWPPLPTLNRAQRRAAKRGGK